MSIDLAHVNWLAVFLSSVSAFLVGGLWYSPFLFEYAWMQAAGLDVAELARRRMGVVFGLSLMLSTIIALTLGLVIEPDQGVLAGTGIGLLVGAGWILPALWIISLFERRPVRYVAINGGYLITALAIMGAVHGAF
jgi:hypothetical protein